MDNKIWIVLGGDFFIDIASPRFIMRDILEEIKKARTVNISKTLNIGGQILTAWVVPNAALIREDFPAPA